MKSFDLGQNWNGTRTQLHISDDELVVRDVMDAQPILDNNARMRNAQARRLKNGYLAASIPPPIYYEWRKAWRQHHRDKWTWHTYLAMKINSRDWCKLKTADMRL